MVIAIYLCLLVMMLVHFTKYLHLLFALSLLGSTFFCCAVIGSKKYPLKRLNRWIILLSIAAMLTGTLLVYPKHYTFHTGWIQAAYLLLILYLLGVFILSWLNKTWLIAPRWALQLGYVMLIVLLLLITHDAVVKKTLLPTPFFEKTLLSEHGHLSLLHHSE